MKALHYITDPSTTGRPRPLPPVLAAFPLTLAGPVRAIEGAWQEGGHSSVVTEDGRLFVAVSYKDLLFEGPTPYALTEPVRDIAHRTPCASTEQSAAVGATSTTTQEIYTVLVRAETGQLYVGGAHYHRCFAADRGRPPVIVDAGSFMVPLALLTVAGPVRRVFPGVEAFLCELEDGRLFGHGENGYNRLGLVVYRGAATRLQEVELATAAHGGLSSVDIEDTYTTVTMRDGVRYRSGVYIAHGFMSGQGRFEVFEG